MFESKTGLFENTSSLASKRRNWDAALKTGEVWREDRRTSHRRDADIRLQHRKLGWETCCVRHTQEDQKPGRLWPGAWELPIGAVTFSPDPSRHIRGAVRQNSTIIPHPRYKEDGASAQRDTTTL